MDSLFKMIERKKYFLKSVGVPGGSLGLGRGNPSWVPSANVKFH